MSVPTNSVRVLMDPIVTPKVYQDIVSLPDSKESIKLVAATAVGQQINFNYTGIPCNTFLDRKITLAFDMDFVVSAPLVSGGVGGVADPPFWPVGNALAGQVEPEGYTLIGQGCLRANPILNNASSIEIEINNQKLSYSASKFLEPLSRFNGGDGPESKRLNKSPVLHDWGRYRPSNTYGGVGDTAVSPYSEALSTDVVNRWDACEYSITYGTRGLAVGNGRQTTINVKWEETLYLSPLTDFDLQGGFYNINNIAINIGFDASHPLKFWSFQERLGYNLTEAPAQPAIAAVDNVVNAALSLSMVTPVAARQTMRLHIITPPFKDVNCPQILPSYKITPVITPGGLIDNAPLITNGAGAFLADFQNGRTARGGNFDIRASNISTSKIPSKIVIFCNDATNNIGGFKANSYGVITSLELSLGNSDNYFVNYSPKDIYQNLCYNKGYKIPYSQYLFTGSVLMIEPQDLAGLDMVAGATCCDNLQIRCQGYNIYPINRNNVATADPATDVTQIPLWGAQSNFQMTVLLITDEVISYTSTDFTSRSLTVDNDEIYAKAESEVAAVPVNSLKDLDRKMSAAGLKEDVIAGLSKVMGGVAQATAWAADHKELISKVLSVAAKTGMSIASVLAALLGGGLSEKESYAELGRMFPAKEISALRRSMKQAGCCDQRAGAMITDEVEFDVVKPRKSLRDRA